jgi:glycosyltransferase involved in cell wall biosynthesis
MRALLSVVERWTIRRAAKINFVSRGFEKYFRDRYPNARFSWFTNGIDDEFITATATVGGHVPRDPAQPLHVLYAGNIGEGQGLHLIVPELARATAGRMRFTIIGDGGRRAALEERLASSGVSNVQLRKPMPRDRLISEYRAADVLFLHLNAHRAFEKVLPSKIFEYAAMGKPVWAGVAGYAAKFVSEEVTNAAVFNPCDANDALRAFAALSIGDAARAQFVARFTRTSIAREMAEDILGLVDATTDVST